MLLAGAVILIGWIVSLCLHEFGHALVAYWGGDTSVKDKGYLTLNPLKYADLGLSLVMPIVFLLLGGIGLPGGAVYIDHKQLRSRGWDSAVSAAGPLANALLIPMLAAPFWLGLADQWRESWFWPSLAFLMILEISAVVFNLLPIPPLDAYGVIRPWLPAQIQAKFNQFGRYGVWVIFGLLWFVPSASRFFWDFIYTVVVILDVPLEAVVQGFRLFDAPLNKVVLIVGLIVLARKLKPPHNSTHNAQAWRWVQRGNQLYKSKRYEAAIAAYDKATEFEPTFSDAWYWRGHALYNLKQYEGAISAYDEALELDPDNLHIWHSRGISLHHLKQYDQAIASFNKTIEHDPTNAEAWYNNACCYSLQGNISTALEALKEAIKLAPERLKDRAQEDPDFEAIRENEGFKRLVG